MSEKVPHIGFCPGCGNTTPQEVLHTHQYQTSWFDPDGTETHDGPDLEALLCACGTCNAPLLYDGLCQWEDSGWPKLAYPASGELPNTVPDSVRDSYAEASKLQATAPGAFAVMIRRALEGVCSDRGVQSGTLVQRLKKLADQGDLPPTIAEATDLLRKVGNTGAHHSDTRITAPMAWALDALFRVVIEYLYIAPSKLQSLRSALTQAEKADA